MWGFSFGGTDTADCSGKKEWQMCVFPGAYFEQEIIEIFPFPLYEYMHGRIMQRVQLRLG
jgi:hypothetical protein